MRPDQFGRRSHSLEERSERQLGVDTFLVGILSRLFKSGTLVAFYSLFAQYTLDSGVSEEQYIEEVIRDLVRQGWMNIPVDKLDKYIAQLKLSYRDQTTRIIVDEEMEDEFDRLRSRD